MEKTRILDENGTFLVRDGIILVFFIQLPFHEIASDLEKVFNIWIASVPNAMITWAYSMTAEVPSKVTSKTIAKFREQFDPNKSSKKDLSGFILQGDEKYNPSYRFDVEGSKQIENDDSIDPETNMVEMLFPANYLLDRGADAFVAMAVEMARALRYDSGYASLSLNWPVDSVRRKAAQKIVPIALRHPGYDVHMNSSTRFVLGHRSRGARWLTFLGDGLVAKLGGRDSLVKKLDPEIQVIEAGAGVAIRAGTEPLPGDVNRSDTLPLLCSVARAIKDVTYFNDEIMLPHMFAADDDRLERWEKRFLKDEE